jgi:hypothetical protein
MIRVPGTKRGEKMSMTNACAIECDVDQNEEKKESEIDNAFVHAHRRRIKESQKVFWSRFGVTQSRGSRFELGANIPKPVMLLLRLYFAGRITDEDISSVTQRRAPAHRPAAFSRDLSNPFGSL